MGSICSKTVRPQQQQQQPTVVAPPEVKETIGVQRALSVIREETAMTVTMTTTRTTTTTVKFADKPDDDRKSSNSPEIVSDNGESDDDATSKTSDASDNDESPSRGHHVRGHRLRSPPPPPRSCDDDDDSEPEVEDDGDERRQLFTTTDEKAEIVAVVAESGNGDSESSAGKSADDSSKSSLPVTDVSELLPVSAASESGREDAQQLPEANFTAEICRLSDDSGVVAVHRDDETIINDAIFGGSGDSGPETAAASSTGIVTSRSDSSVSDATLLMASVSVDERPSTVGEVMTAEDEDADLGHVPPTTKVVRVSSLDGTDMIDVSHLTTARLSMESTSSRERLPIKSRLGITQSKALMDGPDCSRFRVF